MNGVIVRLQTAWWRLKGQRGQTTSEYLVIAGVVVAIIIALMATFQDQISNAIMTLGGQVQTGAGS